MLLPVVQLAGRFVAALPEPFLDGACRLLGALGWALGGKRRRTVLANLHHCFPGRDEAWRRRVARTHFARLAEIALLALALPFLPARRLRALLTPSADPALDPHWLLECPRGEVVSLPHTTLMEGASVLPLLAPGLRLGDIFRPLDDPALNRWILVTRQRHGARLFDRKRELFKALDFLDAGGWLAVPFDQNAGPAGTLALFFGRAAATTDLPGLAAKRAKCGVVAVALRRTAFWRAVVEAERLLPAPVADPAEVIRAQAAWLEGWLGRSEAHAADWLWSHRRWQTQDEPHRHLRLQARKQALPAVLPRRTRFWVRLPNWLGDVVMALPLLRALRASRPDAEVTLVGKGGNRDLLGPLGLCEDFVPLPQRGPGYWNFFWGLRRRYPDTCLLLTNSLRGDAEAWLMGCPQRFGLRWPGRPRPLLTHAWAVPPTLDLRREHQTHLWRQAWESWGLRPECVDFAPFAWPAPVASPGPRVGLICGTENSPEKRWAPERFRKLIETVHRARPDVSWELYGTPGDRPLAARVAEGLAGPAVRNRAGQTTLAEFAGALAGCALVVANDTGGLHLANALGVPVVGLYGPTNPLRTGPVLAAPRALLQPPGCPAAGGLPMAELAVAPVAATVLDWLAA